MQSHWASRATTFTNPEKRSAEVCLLVWVFWRVHANLIHCWLGVLRCTGAGWGLAIKDEQICRLVLLDVRDCPVFWRGMAWFADMRVNMVAEFGANKH